MKNFAQHHIAFKRILQIQNATCSSKRQQRAIKKASTIMVAFRQVQKGENFSHLIGKSDPGLLSQTKWPATCPLSSLFSLTEVHK
jgi:hypothetical protein